MDEDSPLVVSDQRDVAFRALVVKCITDFAQASVVDRRRELSSMLGAGDRVTVRSPDGGGDVGMVYRTKPKGTARISDKYLFTEWMRKHYPDRVQLTQKLDEVDLGEVIQVLVRHAPYLVRNIPVVMPWAENEVLEMTKRSRKPCGPGGEIDVPGVVWDPPGDGVVTVRLSEDGPDVIRRLWREGRVDLESGEVKAVSEIMGGHHGVENT